MRVLVFLLAMTVAAFSATAQELPPLFQSIVQGDEAAVKQLASKDTVNQVISKGKATATPLLFALMKALEGKQKPETMLRIIDTLLERGADPNTITTIGSDDLSIVDFLTFMEQKYASQKKHSPDDVKMMKVIKPLLAKLHKHGGVADKQRVAALEDDYQHYRLKAQKAACESDLRNWATLQEVRHTEKGSYPRKLQLTSRYLKNHSYKSDGKSYHAVFSCKAVPHSLKLTISSENPQPSGSF